MIGPGAAVPEPQILKAEPPGARPAGSRSVRTRRVSL
jgi:hypothetical protein